MLLVHLLACLRPAPALPSLTPFIRRALHVLDVMYGGAPGSVRAEQFSEVVSVVGSVMVVVSDGCGMGVVKEWMR